MLLHRGCLSLPESCTSNGRTRPAAQSVVELASSLLPTYCRGEYLPKETVCLVSSNIHLDFQGEHMRLMQADYAPADCKDAKMASMPRPSRLPVPVEQSRPALPNVALPCSKIWGCDTATGLSCKASVQESYSHTSKAAEAVRAKAIMTTQHNQGRQQMPRRTHSTHYHAQNLPRLGGAPSLAAERHSQVTPYITVARCSGTCCWPRHYPGTDSHNMAPVPSAS